MNGRGVGKGTLEKEEKSKCQRHEKQQRKYCVLGLEEKRTDRRDFPTKTQVPTYRPNT